MLGDVHLSGGSGDTGQQVLPLRIRPESGTGAGTLGTPPGRGGRLLRAGTSGVSLLAVPLRQRGAQATSLLRGVRGHRGVQSALGVARALHGCSPRITQFHLVQDSLQRYQQRHVDVTER